MNKKNDKSNHKNFKKKYKNTIYNQFNKTSKKDNAKEKESYLTTFSESLKLPADVLLGAPIITATGRNEICLENYKGIIEYNGNLIKVQTKTCKICIEGERLNIDYFTNDEMKISGYINSIYYR